MDANTALANFVAKLDALREKRDAKDQATNALNQAQSNFAAADTAERGADDEADIAFGVLTAELAKIGVVAAVPPLPEPAPENL